MFFNNKNKWDLVICGGGSLGCYLGHLLKDSGISFVIVDEQELFHALPDSAPTVFWPTPSDPPTRAVVAHGTFIAQVLETFCSSGIEIFEREAKRLRISFEHLPVSRLALADFEKEELRKAQSLGFGIHATSQPNIFNDLPEGLVAQDLGVTLRKLLASHWKQGKINSIEETRDHTRVTLHSGEVLECEIAVLALNYKARDLVPFFHNILIPMTNVRTVWRVEPTAVDAWRGATGHWTLHRDGGRLEFTGPRFLLPSAGVDWLPSRESELQKIESNVKTFLQEQIAPHLNIKNMQLMQSSFETDCLPYDELPLIGEFGSHGRLLGSAGWLGVGLSANWTCATILKDLLMRGHSDFLEPLLHPRRLRSHS